jgi:hypothetical protein
MNLSVPFAQFHEIPGIPGIPGIPVDVWMSPGQLSDEESDVVGNFAWARTCIQYVLYLYVQ